jgi:hypothetical protein
MPDVRLHLGDCLEVMRGMADGSVDAVVTDPPAAIGFMGRQWDGDRGGRLAWVAWLAERLAECYRLAKPGAYALVWALPRTSHWTGCAVEDAGWRICDVITSINGQGFPKHKSKLKPSSEHWYLAWKPAGKATPLQIDACRVATSDDCVRHIYAGTGNLENWRTGRTACVTGGSPAGRYPSNLVLVHHADCRRVGEKRVKGSGFSRSRPPRSTGDVYGEHRPSEFRDHADPDGFETVAAWECVGGGLCPVRGLDEQSGVLTSGKAPASGFVRNADKFRNAYANFAGNREEPTALYGDSGGASRYFPTFAWDEADFAPYLYCPKASRSDRGEGNTHPTVKPIKLCEWLVKLICPPGGTVLDPFMGSGSIGVASVRQGFGFVGIDDDSEPGAFAIAEKRLAAARAELPLFATA